MTDQTLQPIETVYRGYRFRSRLEARWAVFLDAAGIKWEYEGQGFDLNGVRYLPDFWLPRARVFLEVKPETVWAGSYRELEPTLTALGECQRQ